MDRKGFSTLIILVGVLILLVAVGVMYYFSRSQPVTRPAVTTAAGNPTVKDYSNSQYGLSFQYPSNKYNLEERSVGIGTVAWGAALSNKANQSDLVKDNQAIFVTVRRKLGLSFQNWIEKECKRVAGISDKNIQVSGKAAAQFECDINGDTTGWTVVAIDNGDYVFTLTDVGYKLNTTQESDFQQLLSSFKLTK